MAEGAPLAVTEVAESDKEPQVGSFSDEVALSNVSTADAATNESFSVPDDEVTGMRKRARTHSGFVQQEHVELLVVEHSSLDSTMLSTLGKHAQVSSWKVLVAGRAQPICIEVHVDKSVAMAPKVSVIAREGDMVEEAARIFPAFGDQRMSRMTEDIVHKWTFRGVPKGFREKHFYEARLPNPRSGKDDWIPATVTEWKQDGTFEVRVVLEESFGVQKEVVLVGLKAHDLRERRSSAPLYMSSRSLLLKVPRSAPHKATLVVVEEGEAEDKHPPADATCFLGRWSPTSPGAHCEALPESIMLDAGRKSIANPSPSVQINVTRDKLGLAGVSANVGHRALVDFMSGEVKAVDSKTTPPSALAALKKEWKIQIGSYVEHTIEISRANRLTNVVTVTVDGVRLTQALLSDICSQASDGSWQLPFYLVGDRFLEFQMKDAYSVAQRGQKKLEQTMLPYYERSAFPDLVVTPLRYKHVCRIVMKDISSIGQATLFVDNIHFFKLPRQVPMRSEANVEFPAGKNALDLFSRRYGILFPENEIQNTYTRSVNQGLRSVDQGLRRPVDAFVETLPTMEVVTDSMTNAASCSLDFMSALQASLVSLWTSSSTTTTTEIPETRASL